MSTILSLFLGGLYSRGELEWRNTVMLPLMGLAIGGFLLSLLGASVLAIDPSARLSFVNLAFFVVGAIVGTPLLGLLGPETLLNMPGELRVTTILTVMVISGRLFVQIAQSLGLGLTEESPL